MATQTEKMLTTSWNLVRDAGSAVSDAASNSRIGTNLVRSYPRVKEMVSVGAGLALARRGTKVAIAAVRRHPLASIAGAVALAGVGLALAAAKRRKAASANGHGDAAEERARARRVTPRNMRGSSASSSRVTAEKAPAARSSRSRKTKDTNGD